LTTARIPAMRFAKTKKKQTYDDFETEGFAGIRLCPEARGISQWLTSSVLTRQTTSPLHDAIRQVRLLKEAVGESSADSPSEDRRPSDSGSQAYV
jgi:hypothetical protein